jgi:hypothetical protein
MVKILESKECSGFECPTSGRITYNKMVDYSSFAMFTDIITSIVPLKIVNNENLNYQLPSLARVLDSRYVYKQYLFLNATMDEYMDYQDEEDQDNMTELLQSLKQNGEPIIGIAIQKSVEMQSAHAIAFIAWETSTKFKFAFYDPLAHKRGKKGFDFAERAFVKERFREKIEFVNLDDYCYKINDQGDFHCSQYVINGEYCYMYSLYFLHKWIEFGAKLHRASFKKTINATYIVDASKLSRTNNRESLIYRLTMMAFICRSFLTYLTKLTIDDKKFIKKSASNVKRIVAYVNYIKKTYAIDFMDSKLDFSKL